MLGCRNLLAHVFQHPRETDLLAQRRVINRALAGRLPFRWRRSTMAGVGRRFIRSWYGFQGSRVFGDLLTNGRFVLVARRLCFHFAAGSLVGFVLGIERLAAGPNAEHLTQQFGHAVSPGDLGGVAGGPTTQVEGTHCGVAAVLLGGAFGALPQQSADQVVAFAAHDLLTLGDRAARPVDAAL